MNEIKCRQQEKQVTYPINNKWYSLLSSFPIVLPNQNVEDKKKKDNAFLWINQTHKCFQLKMSFSPLADEFDVLKRL